MVLLSVGTNSHDNGQSTDSPDSMQANVPACYNMLTTFSHEHSDKVREVLDSDHCEEKLCPAKSNNHHNTAQCSESDAQK